SAEAHYVLGTTRKALYSGFNIVRMNMRNCGNTMDFCKTLYNSGLSQDILFIAEELRKEGFKNIFLAGCSMGGNICLKSAGELADNGPDLLSGVIAFSPALDLSPCVDAFENGFNRFYEQNFLRTLKEKIRYKSKQFPEIY